MPTGASQPGSCSQQKAPRDDAAALPVSDPGAERQRFAEGQRLAQLCSQKAPAMQRAEAPAAALPRPTSHRSIAPAVSEAAAPAAPDTSAEGPNQAASGAFEGRRSARQSVRMAAAAPGAKTPAVTVPCPVAPASTAPAASKASASAVAAASASCPGQDASKNGKGVPSQPGSLSTPPLLQRGSFPGAVGALPLPTAACTGLQAACLSQGVLRRGKAAVSQMGLLPPPVYTPFQQQALAASVQAMMTPRSCAAATVAPHVMARLRATMQLALAAVPAAISERSAALSAPVAAPAAAAAYPCVAAHSQALSARVQAISQDLQLSAAAAERASHRVSRATKVAITGLSARTPAGLGSASGLRQHPPQASSLAASAPGRTPTEGEPLPCVDASKALQLAHAMAPGVAKALPQARPALGPHAAGARGGSPVLDQATLRQLAKELVEPVLSVLKPPGQQCLPAAAPPLGSMLQRISAVPCHARRMQTPGQPLPAALDGGPGSARGSPAESASASPPPAKRRRVRVKVVLPPAGEAGGPPPGSPPANQAGLLRKQRGTPPDATHGGPEAMRWSSRAAVELEAFQRGDAAGDLHRCIASTGL